MFFLSSYCYVGEDEISFSRHTKALQNEYKKSHPNPHIVEELTTTSFALRRKDILEHTYDLNTLLSKYPCLRSATMVSITRTLKRIVLRYWNEATPLFRTP